MALRAASFSCQMFGIGRGQPQDDVVPPISNDVGITVRVCNGRTVLVHKMRELLYGRSYQRAYGNKSK